MLMFKAFVVKYSDIDSTLPNYANCVFDIYSNTMSKQRKMRQMLNTFVSFGNSNKATFA